jgi:hypothetical protein
MKSQRNHARHHVRLILALAGLISATAVAGSVASAQTVYPSWSYTGNPNTYHYGHTATLLSDGRVLVFGGSVLPAPNNAEVYDPITGRWSYTGNLNLALTGRTATLLPNGKVLVAGGLGLDNYGHPGTFNNAELYSPDTGTWSITGNLNTGRVYHTATLLPTGKVLVAGGQAQSASLNYFAELNSAELYDPDTGTWSYTGNLRIRLDQHTATPLPDGRVLVAGGETFDAPGSVNYFAPNAEIETYDPATGTWSRAGNLITARFGRKAIGLQNGKVLITGGYGLQSAELCDPTAGTCTNTGNLNDVHYVHTATLLPNGKVLVVGSSLNAELYDPTTGLWTITASPETEVYSHTATLLANGKVLVASGTTAELYDSNASANSNLVDDAKFFVREHYVDFLDREPDADGLAYWTERIVQCGSDARCIHERRIGVSAAFFIELEFQETGYYVYRFYKASFGRQPNYTEFTADRGLYCEDCSTLEESKQYFADGWVQRSAFVAAYPNTMGNTEFVNKLFDTAGLTVSRFDAQRQQEIAAMNAGRSRALVVRDVIEIPDFKNIPDPNDPRYSELKQTSQYNPAFVLMQYFGYLRRDLDQTGYDFWLDVVTNREPSNYHGMICAFITSTEYQLRFGSAVTRSNADCGQ